MLRGVFIRGFRLHTMILRELPDVPPRPKTAANADFRRWLYSRWGKEHAIVAARIHAGHIGPQCQPMSIKAVWGGVCETALDGRRLAIDDDAWLVINQDRSYASRWRSGRPDAPMDALCVFFRRGMPAEVFGAMSLGLEGAADAGGESPRTPEFAERLRPHDGRVSPLLRDLHAAVRAGQDDPVWADEACHELIAAVIAAEHHLQRRAESIRSVRAATRAELLRRVNWAADFILSNYAEPITLDDIAEAASLSKFHLVRLFKQVHQLTPHAFLQRKRAQVARRMLDGSDTDLNDIAAAVGFGTRWTMYRHLRRCFGASGRTLREA
jgi:AraC-like DNA-binding protein